MDSDPLIWINVLGTNDCKTYYNASPEVIGRGIEKLLEQIKTIAGTAKVLLVSPIALGDEVWKTEYDPEFNQHSVEVSKGLKEVYRKIAEKYGCDFLAASDVASPSRVDMEHLNEEGHQKLAEAILGVIERP